MRPLLASSLACVLVLASACGDDGSPGDGSGGGAGPGEGATGSGGGGTQGAGGGAQAVVGVDGGSVETDGAALVVTVPAGALPSDTTITVRKAEGVPTGAVGQAWDVGPSGTQLAVPATLAFSVAALGTDADPATLRAATVVDGAWALLPRPSLEAPTTNVIGETSHFSPFGVVSAVCGTSAAGSGCPAGGGECPPAPRCADGDPCAADLPGSTTTLCTDNDRGWDAECCFPPDAPTCFATASQGSCPAGGGSCPPPPRCDDGDPCGGVPSFAVDTCTDDEYGFSAICCAPPGTPLPEDPTGGGGPGAPPGP